MVDGTGKEVEAVQDEMLEIAHQLDRIRARTLRLEDRIANLEKLRTQAEDAEAMAAGHRPRSLLYELGGDLETAVEIVTEAAQVYRRGGTRTSERLRREFVREGAGIGGSDPVAGEAPE
jgi:hypothetical protein